MRKKVLIIILLLLLCGCKKFTKGEIITANAEEILEKLKSKESFIVYIGYDDCPSCKEYRPILQQLIENYDITIYYLPTDDEKYQSQLDEIQYDYFYRMLWTPTTYIVDNGEVTDLKEKVLEYEDLVSWLDEYGKLEK